MNSGAVSLIATVGWWAGVIGAGVVASRKRRRWWPYVLVAALAPLVGFLAAVAVSDRSGGGRWLGGDSAAHLTDDDREHQEVTALAHWTGIRRARITRELHERGITPAEWADEHGIDPTTWRPRGRRAT